MENSINTIATIDREATISRLHLIEQQPLAERSCAYEALHNELTVIVE